MLFTLNGCSSVPELLEKGRYEKAYAVAEQHCTRVRARNKTLKPKWKLYFQEAYAAIQARDLNRVTELEAEDEAWTWPGRYHLYSALYDRSLAFVSILQEPVDAGLQPALQPDYLAEQMETARLASGRYYLDQAAPHLPLARAGRKSAARDAFYDVEAALDFLPERSSTLLPLLDTLQENGTFRIWLYVRPALEINRTLESATLRLKPLYRDWTEITTSPLADQRIDLEAELEHTNTASTGFEYSSKSSTYEKEVLDYVEKKKEKVKVNDTTWVEQEVEIEHYKTVYATVTTHDVCIAVSAYGQVVTYLPGTAEAHWQSTLSNSERWSESYTTCEGDRRALPACACSGRGSISLPSEAGLVSNAIDGLAWRARDRLMREYGVPEVR